jgi:type IV pilus assembly protein PilM
VLRRNYLGLEICREGLRAIAVQRRGSGAALMGGQTLDFSEGVLLPTVLEPNVRKPERFVDAVREVLVPLAKREKRIAVALPDSSGHVFLLDIDTPFKNYSEGLDIVRWQLKNLLPAQLTKIVVDYQVLEERESGGRRVLASVLADVVLTQYEELLAQAGFSSAQIDFHVLNLFNAYRSRIDLGADFFLIGVDGQQLNVLAFENHLLDFCRTKIVPQDPERIFQEINRSMVGYRRAHSSFARSTVHLHTSWGESDELLKAVSSAFDRNVELLPSPLHQLAGSQKLNISATEAKSLATALGAAERMIQRVAK